MSKLMFTSSTSGLIHKSLKTALSFATLMAMLCVSSVTSHGQSLTQGAIAGTVFDATDAAIPNAKIVVHNDGTNAEVTLTSDASGYFKAPQLDPGTYTVTISASGFGDQRTSNVTVLVSNVTDLSPHLATGSAGTQTVEVSGQVPIIKFEEVPSGLNFDVSFDVANGPQSAELVRAMVARLPAIRPMLLVLKIFLQQRDMNEVSAKSKPVPVPGLNLTRETGQSEHEGNIWSGR